MKWTKWKVAAALVLTLLAVSLVTVPAAARWGQAGGRGCGMGRGMGPAFTKEQQEQVQKIHEKYNDQFADLRNRLNVVLLEAGELEEGESPDFGALEKSIDEAAAIRAEMAKLKLRIHKEIRPLLNDDQKVLFDRGLGRLVSGSMGRRGMMMGRGTGMHHDRMMGRGMRSGMMSAPGAGGMMPGCGMGDTMPGCGMGGMMPGCGMGGMMPGPDTGGAMPGCGMGSMMPGQPDMEQGADSGEEDV